MNADTPRSRTPLQTAALIFLSVTAILFGVFTVHRTACLSRKMGDLDVYLRAGWAVRAGINPYNVTCDNGWHYVYPPPYAILMAPLADPPAENVPDVGWCVPFAVSAGICYALNLLAFLGGIHLLACALEHGRPIDRERWWWLRLGPIFLCIVPLGETLVRGQVNTLLVFLVCAMLAALLSGQSFRGGLYLAAAIALKVLPAYLILLPLWLRDRRCLVGIGVGLIAILGLFPLVTIGPARTYACYERLALSALGPGLRLGGDDVRKRELINTTATDNQSFGAVLHCWLYPDRDTRPQEAAPWTHRVHWCLAGLLTLTTLLVPGRRVLTPGGLTLLTGALATIMVLTSPVCHLHYLVLITPLWMGLLVVDWERRDWQGPAVSARRHLLHLGFLLGLVIPALPGCEPTRDYGLAMGLVLVAWCLAVLELRRGSLGAVCRENVSNSFRALVKGPGTC